MTIKDLGTNMDRQWRIDLNNNFRELSGMQGSVNDAVNKAKTAEQIANEAKAKADTANNTSNSVQEQLNQVVINGDSSVEAAQARVDEKGIVHPTLKDRIDLAGNQIGVLSEKSNDYQKEIISAQLVADGRKLGYNKQCVVSFINDDGNKGQYTDLFPIMSELNVPYGQAIFTSQFDKHTKEMMQNIINLGGDLSSHTVSHAHLSALATEAEIEMELRDSKQWFIDNGVPCDYIVYPFGEVDDRVRRIAKKYYKFGVSTEGKINGYPIEDFSIKRIALGAYFDGTDKNTYEYYKSKLDEAIANKNWIIFMLHSNTSEFNDTQKGYLRRIVQDIRTANIPIMSPTKAYEYYGNAIKVGDNSTGTSGRASQQKFFTLSKQGDLSTNMFTPATMTKYRINAYSWPNIPANGYYEKEFTITNPGVSITSDDVIIFQVRGYFENGIIPVISLKGTNLIKVQLRNVTSSQIAVADRSIYLTVIKNNIPEILTTTTVVG